jgi:hypothetical protein
VSSNFSLVTLSPEISERDFLLYLTLAHRWMADRPWAYSQSGGYSLLFAYLDKARRADQKNVGVFVRDEMVSLVTVEKEQAGAYLIHVTSKRGAPWPAVFDAAYNVGWQAFRSLGAERVYTMSPVWRGHAHRGSVALCEACGLKRTGHEETDLYGVVWREFAMTRQDWLKDHNGQKEN